MEDLTMEDLTMRVDRALGSLLSILFLTLATPASLPAQGAVAAELELERVALFKNGLAFLTYRGELPDDEVLVALDQLPPPTHGSLWVETPPEVGVRGLFLRQVESREERSATTMAELLELNQDQPLVLDLSFKAPSRQLSGTLLSASPEMVVVETEDGLVALPRHQIERVHLVGSEARYRQTVTTTAPALQLMLTKPASGAPFGITLITKGLFWSPSYRIDLSGPRTADLAASALLVNEATELDGVRVDVVTGFPNLAFSDVVSPIDPDVTLPSFFQALQQRNLPRGNASAIVTQVVLSNSMPSADDFRVLPPTTAAGLPIEDLHFTSVGRVDLGVDERALLPLFDVEVPYEHVYTWNIPDFLGADVRYSSNNDKESPPDEAWHSIRLTNDSDRPWTTAPVTFVRDDRLVGQDILHFTPAGGETRVRINKALGIAVEQVEVETARDEAPIELWNYRYRRVTIEGTLTAKNGLGKTATLEITKAFSGELLSATNTPIHTRRTRGLRSANPTNQLLWQLELAAGAEVELRYRHTILVRH